ncbi:hypothetical protein [Pseudonocardia sp. TRM90224]|uniref:hypothetical protein n=1 Tax=Pseudonocardia sp. TRM90224 TaxID=2812678 RepID=UPI001E49C637|nr:hypothetical protein [Pseudonocardia sp. TRM90224]
MEVTYPPPLPPRFPPAAALLNLSGLGLGYAYLGRWLRAVLYLLGTAVLVVLAFLTNAASAVGPWLVVGVAWLLWMAIDGWRLAMWTAPRRVSVAGRIVSTAAGVVTIVALVAGFLVYDGAGRSAYETGLDAQRRGDCNAAVTAFDTVTGPFELTFGPYVTEAAVKRVECDEFTAAVSAGQGDYRGVTTKLKEHRTAHPSSLLLPTVLDRLEGTYRDWAESLRRSDDYSEAITVYRELLTEVPQPRMDPRPALAETYIALATSTAQSMASTSPSVSSAKTAIDALLIVRRELGATPAASQVDGKFAEVFAAGRGDFVKGRWCPSVPVLDYFVGLPAAETSGVVGAANNDRVLALLECGLERFRAGAYLETVEPINKLVTGYPESPQAQLGRAVAISAKVGDGRKTAVEVPASFGTEGTILMKVYNAQPGPMKLLVAGPTAFEIDLPGCTVCAPTYPNDTEACKTFDGRPTVDVRIRAGTYIMFQDGVPNHYQPWVISSGGYYTSCFWIGNQ